MGDAAPSPSRPLEGVLILLVALLVRGALAAIWFGSIDVTNDIDGTVDLHHGVHMGVPYLPLVPLLIWSGGDLAVATQLPLTFCFKLVPILCDSLLAWLLFEWCTRRAPDRSRLVGWLYALAPIPILIACAHGQWDAICLLYVAGAVLLRDTGRPSWARELAIGAALGMACVAKPYPLMLAPVLMPPLLTGRGAWRAYARDLGAAAVGGASVIGLALLVSQLEGYSPSELLLNIAKYSKWGVRIFGLPALGPLRDQTWLANHSWLPPTLLLLAIPYHQGRWTSARAVAITFCFVLAVSLISPQYFAWPIPFFLAAAMYWEAALVTAAGTVFLVLFYSNPLASHEAGENMATFATLRSMTALLPSPLYGGPEWIPLLRTLGNAVLPAVLLLVVANSLRPRRSPTEGRVIEPRSPLAPILIRLTIPLVLIGCLVAFALRVEAHNDPARFATYLRQRFLEYVVERPMGDRHVLGIYSGGSVLGLPTWMLVEGALWSLVAAGAALRLRSRGATPRPLRAE